MTEEEKKEFEEFLQWKAEKNKNQKSEDNSMEVTKETTPKDNHVENSPTANNNVNAQEPPKNNGTSTGFIVVLAIMFISILFVIVMGLSHKSSQSEIADFEDSILVDSDSIAFVDVGDESVLDPVADAAQDSIKRAERINEVKKTIKITSAYLGRPNSASGVDVYFYYKNLSNKTIKYLVWEGYPINAVGDRVACEIRGYADYRGKDTGPIKPGKSSGGCWDCAWYNSTAKKLILTGIDIEYMDGSTFSIKESEIEYVR